MSYSSEVLADSPLLYVRFEETAGATCANDGSLAGNATAQGTYTRNISTGMAGVGVGIDFNGSSGIALYPDTAALDITGDATYECWFNADSRHAAALMSKGGGSGHGYQIEVMANGFMQVRIFQVASACFTSSAVYSAGTWYHVAFTRSGNNYVIYINGSSAGTATDASVASATSESFAIGGDRFSGGSDTFFDGKIDEAAVYNTALSGARIAAHYAARNTGGAAAPTFVPQIVIT